MANCLGAIHGKEIGAPRVRRLMQEADLFGIPRKMRHRSRVRSDSEVPDLLWRTFSAERHNAVWVTEIKQIATREKKLRLWFIEDR